MILWRAIIRKLLTCRNIFLRLWKPNGMLPNQKYIGHARYHCDYQENSLQLYEYLVNVLHYRIVECDIQFDKQDVPVLAHSDLDVTDRSDTLSQLLALYQKSDVVIMLDFLHTHLNIKRSFIINKLLHKYSMQNRVILADGGFLKFAMFYPFYTYQKECVWSNESVKHAIDLKVYGKIILSLPYKGEDIEQYKGLIDVAHKNGILMKVSIINDIAIAKRFLEIGADLIITDEIVNG